MHALCQTLIFEITVNAQNYNTADKKSTRKQRRP